MSLFNQSDIDAYNSKASKKEAEQLDAKIKAENALKEYKNALKYALDCYIEAINELPYLAQVTNTNQCSFYTGFKTKELKLVGRVVNSGHMIKKFKENYGTVYFYADTKGAVFFRYYTYVSEFKDKEHTVSITVDEFKQIFQSIISDIKLPTHAYLYGLHDRLYVLEKIVFYGRYESAENAYIIENYSFYSPDGFKVRNKEEIESAVKDLVLWCLEGKEAKHWEFRKYG